MNPGKLHVGRLVGGLLLIGFGIVLLLSELGLHWLPLEIWQLWPLVLIGLGFAKIVSTGFSQPGGLRSDDAWGGFWLVLVGLYGAVNVWHLFGLHWGNSWPLMIIAVGLMMVVKTLAGSTEPSSQSGGKS